MLSLGTVKRRLSSVTVPTTTIVRLSSSPDLFEAIREMETGGLLIRDIKSRRSTTLLKDDSVRPIEEGLGLIVRSKEVDNYGLRSDKASQGA